MTDEQQPDGPRISEAKRASLQKAREAAARKLREEGPTEKQLAARKRMQEGRAAKAAQSRRVREGGHAPELTSAPGAPQIEPAAHPQRPTSKARAAAPVVVPADPAIVVEPEPAGLVEAPKPSDTPTTTRKRPWILRATGL